MSTPTTVLRPAIPFILLRRGPWLLTLLALLIAAMLWLRGMPAGATFIILIAGAILLLLTWNTLVLLGERYTLGPEALVWESGVLRSLRVEVPLARVQNIVLYRSLGERLFGLGTLGVATAGTDGYELVWSSLTRPHDVLDRIRAAIDAHQRPANDPAVSTHAAPPRSLPVIGLCGGIGAGKSAVASILADLGCLVIDSDQRARAALDRPDVRDQLVAWWGDGVLAPDGRVDRSRVARIVFSDPRERARLEALVHPIVRQDRAAMIAEASAVSGNAPARFRAIVIDAPLLFEAGLDRECDTIIFVDAPADQRLRRVQASRGWSAEELARREAAQWPLERKRAASAHVVNNADGADPTPQLRTILDGLA
jgi:dephospho-CoA kinase